MQIAGVQGNLSAKKMCSIQMCRGAGLLGLFDSAWEHICNPVDLDARRVGHAMC